MRESIWQVSTKLQKNGDRKLVRRLRGCYRKLVLSNCSVDLSFGDIGAAKGTFYCYFKSKEESLGAIVARALRHIEEMTGQVSDK